MGEITVDTMKIHIENTIDNYRVQLKIYQKQEKQYIYNVDMLFKHIHQKKEFKIQQHVYADTFSKNMRKITDVPFSDTTINIKLDHDPFPPNLYCMGIQPFDFVDIDFDGQKELAVKYWADQWNVCKIYRINENNVESVDLKEIGLEHIKPRYGSYLIVNSYNKILIEQQRGAVLGYKQDSTGRFYCFWSLTHNTDGTISINFNDLPNYKEMINQYLYPLQNATFTKYPIAHKKSQIP